MRKWTIIMQISGENNLLPDNIGIFNEFAVNGSNDDVAFVIILDAIRVRGDLPPKYDYLTGASFDLPGVYLSRKGKKLKDTRAEARFSDNLVSKENLIEILNYIKTNFEAEHYGFIYNGHGGAGQTDVSDARFISEVVTIRDDEYDQNGDPDIQTITNRLIDESEMANGEGWTLDYVFFLDDDRPQPEILLAIFSKPAEEEEEIADLTYKAISEVLQVVFDKPELGFVLLDCCWGMMAENVKIFEPATRFLIASADETPALGIGYRQLCESILERPQIKPDELAKMFVAVFYTERYADYEDPDDPENSVFANMGVSLTCANTLEFRTKVLPNLEALCTALIHAMPTFTDNLRRALDACKDYTYANPQVYDMYNIDLVWLLENIIFQNQSPSTSFEREINRLAFELVRDLKIYLMPAFLANNYPNAQLGGVKAIGGRGISITFRLKAEYYDDARISESFFPIEAWKEMVKKFFDICTVKWMKETQGIEIPLDALNGIKRVPLKEITEIRSAWKLAFKRENTRRDFDR